MGPPVESQGAQEGTLDIVIETKAADLDEQATVTPHHLGRAVDPNARPYAETRHHGGANQKRPRHRPVKIDGVAKNGSE